MSANSSTSRCRCTFSIQRAFCQLLAGLLLMSSVACFAPLQPLRPLQPVSSSTSPNNSIRTVPTKRASKTKQQMMPVDDYYSSSTTMSILDSLSSPSSLLTHFQSTSNYIATVSADIDSIPNDEFAKVFAGGIVVMIGGVASALMVGFLLESNNSYASVVADSYAQGGDEEFWESLSPEDQVKAKELIAKLKASKSKSKSGGGTDADGADASVDDGAVSAVSADTIQVAKEMEGSPTPTPTKQQEAPTEQKKENKVVSMFSDYDD